MGTINIQEVEQHRAKKSLRLRINLILFFVIPAIGIPVMVILQDEKGPIFYLAFALMVLNLFRSIMEYLTIYNAYEKYFREQIIGKIIKSDYPELNYTSSHNMPREELDDSGLFRFPFSVVECKEHYSGKHNDTSLNMSVLNCRSGGDSVFNGLFVSAEIPNLTANTIYIFPKSKGGLLGALADGVSYKPVAPELNLGFGEFEEQFTVFSQSAKAAHRFLTEKKRTAIIELQKQHTHAKLSISITNSKINIIISNFINSYIIDSKKSVLNKSVIKGVFKDLDDQLRFIEILSKE